MRLSAGYVLLERRPVIRLERKSDYLTNAGPPLPLVRGVQAREIPETHVDPDRCRQVIARANEDSLETIPLKASCCQRTQPAREAALMMLRNRRDSRELTTTRKHATLRVGDATRSRHGLLRRIVRRRQDPP